MFTRRLGQIFERSREHWLFVPLFVLLILSLIYVFFIGDKGFMAYRIKTIERDDLRRQIAAFGRQKEELKQKLSMLRDKDQAVRKFSKDFYLFQEKVRILKFRENAEDKPAEDAGVADIAATQKFYIVFSSIAIALVTLFFYRRNNARIQMDKVRPFQLHEDA